MSFLSVQFPSEHFRDCSYGLERKTRADRVTETTGKRDVKKVRTGSVKRGQRRRGCRKRWRVVSYPRQMQSTTSLTSGERSILSSGINHDRHCLSALIGSNPNFRYAWVTFMFWKCKNVRFSIGEFNEEICENVSWRSPISSSVNGCYWVDLTRRGRVRVIGLLENKQRFCFYFLFFSVLRSYAFCLL